jgi:hypothetical protein
MPSLLPLRQVRSCKAHCAMHGPSLLVLFRLSLRRLCLSALFSLALRRLRLLVLSHLVLRRLRLLVLFSLALCGLRLLVLFSLALRRLRQLGVTAVFCQKYCLRRGWRSDGQRHPRRETLST